MATPLATDLLARVTDALEPRRDPAKAGPMRAYMRDQFDFLGIPKPARDHAVRAALAGLGTPTADDLESVARLTWARPDREYRYVGVQYLRRHVKLLPASFIDTARFLLITDPWWDTVDEIAQNIVGPLVLAHPDLVAVMDAWIDDDDL